jgi:hypothetical protein
MNKKDADFVEKEFERRKDNSCFSAFENDKLKI